MEVSILAFFGSLPEDLLAELGTQFGLVGLLDSAGQLSKDEFLAAYNGITNEARSEIMEAIESIQFVANGGARAVLLPACGDDRDLLVRLEELETDRAKATALYLHEKPLRRISVSFDRALLLKECHADSGGGKFWHRYEAPSLKPDWSMPENWQSEYYNKAKEIAASVEHVERDIHLDSFARPAFLQFQSADQCCFYFLVSVSLPKEQREEWFDGRLGFRLSEGNRRIVIAVTPHSKVVECGHGPQDRTLAIALCEGFADCFIGRDGGLVPLVDGDFDVSPLTTRPDFQVHQEHYIADVSVRRLVVLWPPGIRVYQVPAKADQDAYDVMGKRHPALSADRIISAKIRVRFKHPGERQRSVTFEVAPPNKCTLRENITHQRLIIEEYLQQWGLEKKGLASEGGDYLALDRRRDAFGQLLLDGHHAFSPKQLGILSNEGVEALYGIGVLRSEQDADGYACADCSAIHPVKPDLLGNWIYCLKQGLIQPDADSLSQFSTSSAGIAMLLAETLSLNTDVQRCVIDGRLFVLGTHNEPRNWTAIFAPFTANSIEIDEVMDALGKGVGKERGVLIVGTALPKATKVPSKHAPVVLDDLVRLNEDGSLTLHNEVLDAALNGKSLPGKRGRRSHRTEAVRLHRSRIAFGVSSAEPKAEALAVLAWLAHIYPKDKIPTLKTIQYDYLGLKS